MHCIAKMNAQLILQNTAVSVYLRHQFDAQGHCFSRIFSTVQEN
jgi:hypothetical protein